MSYLLIILLFCIISIIILIVLLNKKQTILTNTIFEKHKIETLKKEELKYYFKEEWEQEKEKLNKDKEIFITNINSNKAELEHQYKLDASKYGSEIKQLEVKLKEKEQRYNEVNQDLDLYKKGKIKEIDSTAAEYKEHQQTIIKNELDQYHQEWLQKYAEEFVKIDESRTQKLEELSKINSELESERAKRAAINEEILRQRKIEDQQDFFRIQLNPDDANDIEILRSVTARLRHPEAINKVIWTGYYQKPLAELRKRLLPNGDISGIYKITRLKTNEIYIGQTTSMDKRFQEHTKTALGVGTLASSQLHRAMSEDGPEKFTFEVLEETPKDKLRERESYYIDFYDSKTYGLNTISGDKK